MTRMDVPADKGQCDTRLQIDAEADVSVWRDLVHSRTISGRDGRDDGSESNAPPARDVHGFRFEVTDGRGGIRLLSPPSRRSGYQGELFGSLPQPGDSDHRIVPLRAASTEMPFSVRMLPMARSSAARALT